MVYVEFESIVFQAESFDAAVAFLERDGWVDQEPPDFPRKTHFQKKNPDVFDREHPVLCAHIVIDDFHPFPLQALPSVVSTRHHL